MRWMLLLALVSCAPDDGPSAPAPGGELPRIASAAPEEELPVPTTPDRAALAELLHHVPKDAPPPTGSSGTRVGTDSGVPGEAAVVHGRRASDDPGVRAGPIELQPLLSSPAIERAAREQIYWSLRKCTGPDGNPPPPESITLKFTIEADGSVDPASVSTEVADPALEPTAECVLTAFSASPFRGPAATRRASARVIITWPSVD
jgi:hypothetical protein